MDNQNSGGMDLFFDKVAGRWKKVKEFFASISEDWEEGRKPRAAGKVILPLVPVALLIGVLVFIWKNREAILSGLIVLVTFCSIIGYFLDRNAERKRAEAERLELARQAAIREKASTQERIYQKMGKVVWAVARELGHLGIVPPNRLGDIYSPTRIIPKRGGEVLLGLYLLTKSRDDVNTDLLTTTMQTKADQKLAAGDFPDIDEKYDSLAIDSVKDSLGFVEVYTALADEGYYRYLAERDLDKDTPPPSIDRRDVDY